MGESNIEINDFFKLLHVSNEGKNKDVFAAMFFLAGVIKDYGEIEKQHGSITYTVSEWCKDRNKAYKKFFSNIKISEKKYKLCNLEEFSNSYFIKNVCDLTEHIWKKMQKQFSESTFDVDCETSSQKEFVDSLLKSFRTICNITGGKDNIQESSVSKPQSVTEPHLNENESDNSLEEVLEKEFGLTPTLYLKSWMYLIKEQHGYEDPRRIIEETVKYALHNDIKDLCIDKVNYKELYVNIFAWLFNTSSDEFLYAISIDFNAYEESDEDSIMEHIIEDFNVIVLDLVCTHDTFWDIVCKIRLLWDRDKTYNPSMHVLKKPMINRIINEVVADRKRIKSELSRCECDCGYFPNYKDCPYIVDVIDEINDIVVERVYSIINDHEGHIKTLAGITDNEIEDIVMNIMEYELGTYDLAYELCKEQLH